MTGSGDVTLFGHWICPYSVRVSFALAERDIAHDVVDVPPTAARPPGWLPGTRSNTYSAQNGDQMLSSKLALA